MTTIFHGGGAMKRILRLIVFLGVFLSLPALASVLVVQDRLFVIEQSFWDRIRGKTPEALEIVARIMNDATRPVEVRADAEIVTLDERGRAVPSGKFLEVSPQATTTYPNKLTHFKIRFPVTTGTLAFFKVFPAGGSTGEGIKLRAGGGFVLGALWVKGNYKPTRPSFTLDGDHIRVSNNSDLLMRLTLVGQRDGEDVETVPFFLEPCKDRLFPVHDACDCYLLDWMSGESRLGLRLER